MTTLIRTAEPEDLPAITRIYSHHVRHGSGTFEEEPPSLAEMTSRWQGLVEKDYPFLVACTHNTVSGFAYAGPHKARSAYRYTVEDSIYIDPDSVGLGLGRALLIDLIGRCTESGYRQMMAVIGDSDNRASLTLHERLGFHRIGVAKDVGFKHERWLDIVYMQRALSVG